MNRTTPSSETGELSGYAALIREANGAPRDLLGLLENIMRDEVFHSVLDWQTRDELAEGARRAYERYRLNAAYYDAQTVVDAGAHQLAQAEMRLADALDAAEICASSSRVGSAKTAYAAAQRALLLQCGDSSR